MSYKIERIHIEQLILSCFLNQARTNEIDQMEFREYRLPFEIFKANKTIKMTAKAIFNLQEKNIPVDDVTVLAYIEDRAKIDVQEYLEIFAYHWTTFDTMISYLDRLKSIDEDEEKIKKLKAMK